MESQGFAQAHLRLFSSYSPAEVVLRYAAQENPQPPAGPEQEDFEAAIGFVDVSGFTALSEKLNAQHARSKGAELLNKHAAAPAHLRPRSHAPSPHSLGFPNVNAANDPRFALAQTSSILASRARTLLCRYINSYFERLLDVVFLHGGDVIKFAGDAMQVVWRNRRGAADSLPMLVLRASCCCLDLLTQHNNFSPPNVEGVLLKLHVGVGAGNLSSFYVGGYSGKWEYFVAGEPIEQMSDATEEATHGQLVLSTYAYQLLRDDTETARRYALTGSELESTQFLLTDVVAALPGGASADALDAASLEPNARRVSHARDAFPSSMRRAFTVRPSLQLEKVLRCFVPSLIEERVNAGQVGVWTSEHRKLVSVFMKVLGLGARPCEVADLQTAHEAVRVVQETIMRSDGTITRLICDDKGTRFLIAFGLPGHATDEDESSAVLASLNVIRELKRIRPVGIVSPEKASADKDGDKDESEPPSVSVAVGITTGRVFCGEAGSNQRREYTLAGARVNLAARLMQAAGKTAEKGILVDKETFNAARTTGGCSWEVLQPIKVKGKDEEVAIFRPRLGNERKIIDHYSEGASLARESSSGSIRPRGSSSASEHGTVGAHGNMQRQKRTLGRKEEQKLLQMGLDKLHGAGTGGAIMLLGESGMGKTHLVQVLHAMHNRSSKREAPSEASTDMQHAKESVASKDKSQESLMSNGGLNLGLFVSTSKPVEATTPFFMWKGVFEKLFATRTLARIIARTKRVKGVPSSEESFGQQLQSIWGDGRSQRSAWLRKKWRDAYSSVLAFQLPSYICAGRHSIRQSVDNELLNDEQFVQLAPLLSPVLPLAIKDNEMTRHMTGETRMNATIRLIVHVLRAKLGHGRPVIVFEDVHWMDSSSWAVLDAALNEVNPMLVLLTLRPISESMRPPAYKQIAGKHQLCEGAVVELQGLGKEDLSDLICESVAVSQVHPDLLNEMANKSNGNPFWALEYSRYGVIVNTNEGETQLTKDGDRQDMPSSIEALITSRMDRLSAGEQLIMKMASVMGTTFSTTHLFFLAQELVLDLPTGAALVAQLERLCEAEMLQRDPSGRADDYQFKHATYQYVSYSLLPEELKERLHRAAGQFFERNGGAIKNSRGVTVSQQKASKMAAMLGADPSGSRPLTEEVISQLHYHWSLAGDDEYACSQAVKYLTLAGDKALQNFMLPDARGLLSKALARAEQASHLKQERGPLHRRIAQCHLSIGELQECRGALTSALIALDGEKHGLFEQLSERDFASRYWKIRSWHTLVMLLARPKQQPIAINTGDQLSLPRSQELAIAYELLAQVSMQDNQRELAGYCAIRALRLGEALPTLTPVVARAYASLCLVESAAENTSKWALDRYKSKARQTCEALGELGQLSYTLLSVGVLDAGQARWEASYDNLHKAGTISLQLKDKRQWEESICHQAHLEYYHGNFKSSKDLYIEAQTSANARGDKQINNRCNAGIAAVLLATNDTAGAISILETTNSWGQFALALLRSGKRDEAFEKAMLVKDRFKGRRTKYYVLKAYASTAEVILKLLEDAIALEGESAQQRQRQRQPPSSDRVTRVGGGRTGFKVSERISNTSEEGGGSVRLADPSSLETLAQEWIERLTEFGRIYFVAKPRALLLHGQFLALGTTKAKQKQAARTFKKSLNEARKLQMPYDEGLALYELGKHAESHHQMKLTHLKRAQDLFESCGAQYDVLRCHVQLQRMQAKSGGGGDAHATDHEGRKTALFASASGVGPDERGGGGGSRHYEADDYSV